MPGAHFGNGAARRQRWARSEPAGVGASRASPPPACPPTLQPPPFSGDSTVPFFRHLSCTRAMPFAPLSSAWAPAVRSSRGEAVGRGCFLALGTVLVLPAGRRTGNFVELPVQLSIKTVDLKSVAVNLIYLKGLPGNGVPAVWRRSGGIGFRRYSCFRKGCPRPKYPVLKGKEIQNRASIFKPRS